MEVETNQIQPKRPQKRSQKKIKNFNNLLSVILFYILNEGKSSRINYGIQQISSHSEESEDQMQSFSSLILIISSFMERWWT